MNNLADLFQLSREKRVFPRPEESPPTIGTRGYSDAAPQEMTMQQFYEMLQKYKGY